MKVLSYIEVVAIAAMLTVMIQACSLLRGDQHDPRLYGGDSEAEALVRAEDPKDVVKCSDPRFDDFVCLSRSDYKTWRAKCAVPSSEPEGHSPGK